MIGVRLSSLAEDLDQIDPLTRHQAPARPSSVCAKCGMHGSLDAEGVCHRHRPRELKPEVRAAARERLAKANAARVRTPAREPRRQPVMRCTICRQPTHRVEAGMCGKCEAEVERLVQTPAPSATETTGFVEPVDPGPSIPVPASVDEHLGVIAGYIDRVVELETENRDLRAQLAEEAGRRQSLEDAVAKIAQRIRG